MQNIIDQIMSLIKSRNVESIILRRSNLSYLIPASDRKNVPLLLSFTLANYDLSNPPSHIGIQGTDLLVEF